MEAFRTSEQPYSSSSIKQLIKNSFCIPCSFRKHHRHHHLHHDDNDSPRLTRTSSCSPKSSFHRDDVARANHNNNSYPPHLRNRHRHDNSLPGKCKKFLFGGGIGNKQPQSYNQHGRRHSADFRYDADSYALNFDEDAAHLDDCPLRSFSSRLPASPDPRNDQAMAGGGIVSHGKTYPGNFTWRVFITCLVAATGGLIFGYDLGISGGVTSMDSFLEKFFPNVYRKESSTKPSDDQYCKFDSQTMTLFTSCLYLAALVSSLVSAPATRMFGRKYTMLAGGFLFLVGGLLNGFAQSVWMLYVGRIFLGFGIGCANQSAPIYISEVAPYKYRGALNMMFQLSITIGILAAGLINYYTAKISSGMGWRLSLGLAVVPAVIIILGALFLSDTPSSLIERGHIDEAKTLLVKIRGIPNIEEELNDLIETSKEANMVKHPWSNLMRRKYRPQLVFAMAIPFFQQLTGMNVFVFYAPVLFKTLGFGSNAALFSSLITNIVNAVATLVSIIFVDKFGRRFFFLEGGVQMFLCQVVMTIAIAMKFGTSGNPGDLSHGFSAVVVIAMCIYIAGFAWSWGPLGWLVPSEIFPLEIRSAAQSINVSVNMIFTFAIAQVFTAMLCHMKFGLFIFFSCFVVIMTAFIYKYLPETKGVPIEEMAMVWEEHPFWRSYVVKEETQDQKLSKV